MSTESWRNKVLLLPEEGNGDESSYLAAALNLAGYSVHIVRTVSEINNILRQDEAAFSIVVLDYLWTGRDGLDTLMEIRSIIPEVPIIMTAESFSPQLVVRAMKHGAADFLPKPVNSEDLCQAIQNVLAGQIPAESCLTQKPAAPWGKNIFFGSNPYMRELETLIAQIGWSQAPLLIEGETGAGKEVLARELHARSTRAQKRFLKLNCAALPSELVESELFGYERGAFTGAFQKKLGMFELADGGTIFLDEIGDMDIKLQAKLLQVLQDQEFQRLGGKETVKVDVRVMAATHRDLEKAIAQKQFREDLYYRLNVISLRVPPLRERKDDILAITGFLMKKYQTAGYPLPSMNEALKSALLDYQWPGNIRELENLVRKFLILKDPDLVARDLRQKMGRCSANSTTHPTAANEQESAADTTILGQVSKAKQDAERTAILAALHSTQWNRKKAALVLKIEYKALLYKMRKLAIEDKMATMPVAEPAKVEPAKVEPSVVV